LSRRAARRRRGRRVEINWRTTAGASIVLGVPSELDITQLLARAAGGEKAAADELFVLLHDDLKVLARVAKRKVGAPLTLAQTSAIVNELYVRWIKNGFPDLKCRLIFFSVAARAMQNLIISYRRGKRAEKRGGSLNRVALDQVDVANPNDEVDKIDHERLASALEKLRDSDERLHTVMTLLFYGGQTHEEIARMLGYENERTSRRLWKKAQAFLYEKMKEQA